MCHGKPEPRLSGPFFWTLPQPPPWLAHLQAPLIHTAPRVVLLRSKHSSKPCKASMPWETLCHRRPITAGPNLDSCLTPSLMLSLSLAPSTFPRVTLRTLSAPLFTMPLDLSSVLSKSDSSRSNSGKPFRAPRCLPAPSTLEGSSAAGFHSPCFMSSLHYRNVSNSKTRNKMMEYAEGYYG